MHTSDIVQPPGVSVFGLSKLNLKMTYFKCGAEFARRLKQGVTLTGTDDWNGVIKKSSENVTPSNNKSEFENCGVLSFRCFCFLRE